MLRVKNDNKDLRAFFVDKHLNPSLIFEGKVSSRTLDTEIGSTLRHILDKGRSECQLQTPH